MQITTQLGYVDRAQVIAIRGSLLTEIHDTNLNIERLNDLNEYLIKLFENPRVKKAYGQNTSEEAMIGVFSMGKFIDEYTTQVN